MVSKALGKYVQSLHQKKYRQRHGAFLVEGGKSVMELLSSDLETEHVLLTAEFASQNVEDVCRKAPLRRCRLGLCAVVSHDDVVPVALEPAPD